MLGVILPLHLGLLFTRWREGAVDFLLLLETRVFGRYEFLGGGFTKLIGLLVGDAVPCVVAQ